MCATLLWIYPRKTESLMISINSTEQLATAFKNVCELLCIIKLNTLIYACWLPRFSQGLRMRQVDLMDDGVAASSRTLSRMAATLRKVWSEIYAPIQTRYSLMSDIMCNY